MILQLELRRSIALALTCGTAALAVVTPGEAAASSTFDTQNSAQTQPKGPPAKRWTQTLNVHLSPRRLRLPADASARRLARAALKRHARRLRLRASLSGLRLERRLGAGGGAGALRFLRFRQTVGGVRVLWSQIDVEISAGKVRSISATVVPVRFGHLAGQRRVRPNRALEIARRVVRGRERSLPPLLVAYAGTPTTRKARPHTPRLAYVVEVTPTGEFGKHSPTPLCVVVDAQTGRPIASWKGHAARPGRDGPDLRAEGVTPSAGAAVTTTLMNVFDANNRTPGNGDTWYAHLSTTGDPFTRSGFPHDLQPSFKADYRDPDMDSVTYHSRNVIKHLCAGHFGVPFCGRDGGSNGLGWVPFGVTGRVAESTRYANEHVFVNQRDSRADDAIAHEFGHHVHKTFTGDLIFDGGEAEEVQEAIADMFAYDFDRNDATLSEDSLGGPYRNWADPGALRLLGSRYPAVMSDYICGVAEDFPHYNSTILSHAYYLFVQQPGVGHGRAGNVLRAATYDLSPRPSFVEVKDRFIARSAELFTANVAPQVAAAAKRAFVDEVGIGRVDPGCPARRLEGLPAPDLPPTEPPTLE